MQSTEVIRRRGPGARDAEPHPTRLLRWDGFPPMCERRLRPGTQRLEVRRDVTDVLVGELRKRRHSARRTAPHGFAHLVVVWPALREPGPHAAAAKSPGPYLTVLTHVEPPPFDRAPIVVIEA